MKKIIALLMVMGMTLSLAACGGTTASSETESAQASEAETVSEATESEAVESETSTTVSETAAATDDTLVVGFDQDFPPFGFVGDDGEYTGFDIEMAQEAAKIMGKEIVLQPIDWDAKDLELEAGTIDCIWNGFTINGREDAYTWTDAYMDNSQVVVTRVDSGINSLSDLAGKVVEVQKESSAESALNDDDHVDLLASFAQLITVGDYNTAFMDLESGAVDAVAIDIGVAKFQIEGKEDTFKILDETVSTEQYGVGFLLGNTQLRDEVQAAMMELVETGVFAEISNEYFGYDVCILGDN
ncbi:MAG: transporter substrate-binding domain-containing protein [Lachnospiraceae bacterium]